ncbi:hypothetical protein GAMM_60156 [Gammaproteobacteria bacterium]
MPEPILSYTKMLFLLWGLDMPGLREYAQQHSTATKKDKNSPLSSNQIQEAYSHPSAIIQQSLKAAAAIQKVLNASRAKLDTIADQRSKIESVLTELHALDNPADDILAELHQQLLTLRTSETSIEAISDKLKQELSNVDKLLLQQAQEWQQHREKFFDQLVTQIKTMEEPNNIVLTDAEKTELRRGSATASSIQEKLQTLEKLQIKLPNRISDFVIITYDTVVACLSHALQEVNNKTVRGITEELRDVIDKEDKASNKLKSDHAKQYEQVIDTVEQLEVQISQNPVLSPDKLQRLKQIEKRATEQPVKAKEEAAAPD